MLGLRLNLNRLFPLVLLVLYSCKNNREEAQLVVKRANVNIEKGKEVEINYSDKGIIRIRAIAPSATRFNKEKPYLI